MKKFFLNAILFLVSLIAVPSLAKKPPNIIFIVYDDLNTDPTHDPASPILTPYLDKLAKQSLSFTNAVANVPVCNPSRASFLSGLLPTTNGAYLNGADAWHKPGSVLKDTVSMPRHFRQHGYLTWGAGKIFHSPMSEERLRKIFDVRPKVSDNFFGPFGDDKHSYIVKAKNKFLNIQAWRGDDSDFPDVQNADAAIEFLAQKHEKPFFMFYGLWRPHTPYVSPKRFFDMYENHIFTLPTAYKKNDIDDVTEYGRLFSSNLRRVRDENGKIDFDLWQKMLWGYAAGTTFADWNMGRIIEALDKSRYAENTIVIVTSDNGFHLGDKDRWGKGTLWGRAAAVPFLVRGANIEKGKSDVSIGLVDIYPTLVDYAGVPLPEHQLDGNSLTPWFRSPELAMKEPNFFAYDKHNASIEDERYRYIRYRDGSEEFYDHQSDPHEHKNLASEKKYRETMDKLAERIPKKWALSMGGRSETVKEGQTVIVPSEYKPEHKAEE